MRNPMQCVFVQCAAVASIVMALATPLPAGDAVDANQPYTAKLSSPVVWDGELLHVLTAPYKTKKLCVWVPVPQDDAAQTVLLSEFSTFPVEVSPQVNSESVFGNRFACFEFANPLGAVVIRQRLRVRTHELNWHLDAEKIRAPVSWPDSFSPYLRSEEQAVVADERFQQLLTEILPQRSNPLLDLDAVMGFADRNFTYNHNNASLKASSLHALNERSGHCSDYHGFCAAMGRLLALPTRVAYGINPFPKASPSHCKLEAYLPPYGWVAFDVSETQKLANAIRSDASRSASQKEQLVQAAHARMISGFRDNTYILMTRGTDYELAPQASRRVAVVRTHYAEADGLPLPDPDPSNSTETRFASMTAHRFESDVTAPNPYSDPDSLVLRP